MSEYTPDTEKVRSGYSNHFETVRGVMIHKFAIVEDGRDEFDRWLASVKADAYRAGYNRATSDIVDEERSRKAKADVWQEAYGQGKYDGLYGFTIANPYRGGTE